MFCPPLYKTDLHKMVVVNDMSLLVQIAKLLSSLAIKFILGSMSHTVLCDMHLFQCCGIHIACIKPVTKIYIVQCRLLEVQKWRGTGGQDLGSIGGGRGTGDGRGKGGKQEF